jgi:hypothetical protein
MNGYSSKTSCKLVLVFILALGLSGCGGGGDSAPQQNPPVINNPASQAITGAGVKGPLANAVVTIFAFDVTQPGFKGSVVTTASTDASSAITGLNLPLPLHPPYIMEFTSVPGTTTDITTGVSPVITTMRTVITQALLDSGQGIYATPLTTLAVDIAVMNAADANGIAGIQGDEFEAALTLAATKVISTLGFGLDNSIDIFDTPPLINSVTVSTAEQANVAAYRMAIEAITAIAYQISQQWVATSADTVLADLAADLADNDIIDGSSGGTLNVNTLQVLQQNPSLLFIPNTSPAQTIADVQAILVAETAITGSTTATTQLLDGTIVIQTIPAKIITDADGDGVLNVDDAFPNSPLADTDTDGDGLPDVIYLPDVGNDSNSDGLDDRLVPAVIDMAASSDADDDNDSWLDIEDDFPLDATRFLDPALDRDSDTVANGSDNCPLNPNTDQADANANGLGDVCDADADGDGVPNDGSDNCPLNANPSQIDTDTDGTGDACDPDIDGDGELNAADAFPFDATETIDTDGDGIGNNTDTDDDNDAVIDILDTGFSPLPGGEPCSLLQDCDGDGVLDSADADPTDPNVTINFAPITNDDMKTVNEDAAAFLIDVTANDIDDTIILTAFGSNDSSLGTLALSGNSIEYTPVANANGTDTFSYTVTDGFLSSQGSVTVTIVAVNDSPVAIDDTVTTAEDIVVITGDVTANDTDMDGDVLTATLLSNASNGNVVDNNNGTFTYTPAVNFNGADSFTYTLSDGNAGTATATVNIIVNSVNDLPVGNADSFTADAITATVLDVLANDTDVDSTLTISNVSQGSLGSTVTHNGSTVTFTDINNTAGLEIFTYDVTDGAAIVTGINVTVNIMTHLPNTPPVANDDNVTTTIDTTFFFNVLDNDTDTDGDDLSVLLPTPNTAPANGSILYNGGGTFTYTPNTGFIGTDNFTYTVTDSIASATATVMITVTPPGAPIDIVTLMSVAEGGVAGIENAETNAYAYWTDNYDPVSTVFSPEEKVYNHLSAVFDAVANNGDLLLSGTQWVTEGDIIGNEDGIGGLDLTILDANNVNVEVARFKLTAHFLDLNNVRIIDHLNTAWQGAMINPDATFQMGAKLITDYRFETLVESHALAQDSSCQRDGTAKFADLNANCNSVDVDNVINTTGYAQLLSDVVAATTWLDPADFSTPAGAVSIATNHVTNKTLMVQLVSGGAANYYVVDWSNSSAFAFVANAVAGANWVQNADSGVDMIHFQVPASFITQFSDDLSAGINYFLAVQNGFVRQGLKRAIGDVEFSDGQFNGLAFNNILTNFSVPVIPGLAELAGTWVSSVVSSNGDPALIHIFDNGNYESSGTCETDGSTGMEYGTVSVSANGSTTNIIVIAQVTTQGLCGPAQGGKTLAVNSDVLILSEPGFADIIYNRLLGTLNPVVGSWLLGNIQDPGEAHTILTVLDDTTFALSQDCTTDSVSGFEYGTYVWDQGNTNDLTGTLIIDSNAGCGLHNNTALSISGFTVIVVGDTLTLTDSVGGNFIFSRISPAYVIPMLQVVYTLDNLMMLDDVVGDEGEQITGSFIWEYVEGDFAGGSGQFTDLTIPGYGTDITALTINIDMQAVIEISLAVNVHNNGVSINLDLLQPLSLTVPSPINLDTSKYEIEIGARAGVFVSGTISPQVTP